MPWWQQLLDALGQDFSDLPDAGHATRIVARLLVAATLGGLLGYEWERAAKAAGLRTHMLVAPGAALFVLIPQQSGAAPAEMTRVLQGVVTGVGFLGARAINRIRSGRHLACPGSNGGDIVVRSST